MSLFNKITIAAILINHLVSAVNINFYSRDNCGGNRGFACLDIDPWVCCEASAGHTRAWSSMSLANMPIKEWDHTSYGSIAWEHDNQANNPDCGVTLHLLADENVAKCMTEPKVITGGSYDYHPKRLARAHSKKVFRAVQADHVFYENEGVRYYMSMKDAEMFDQWMNITDSNDGGLRHSFMKKNHDFSEKI